MMKTSQKGTKLNDIRCFRQSRPYARRRITKSRLIPDLPGLHGSAKEEISLSICPRSSAKSRDRCITLDREQRSREIAWISYTSDSEDSEEFFAGRDDSSGRWHDTFVETETERELLVCFPDPADSGSETVENVRIERKSESEKEVQVELKLQVEEKNIGVREFVALSEESELPEKSESLKKSEPSEKSESLEKSEPSEKSELLQKSESLKKSEPSEKSESLEKSELSEKSEPPEKAKPPEKSPPPIPVKPENITVIFPAKPEVHKRRERETEREVSQEIPHVRSNKNSTDSERSFWLRYSGFRKILDFFGHFLGKRATDDRDKEAAKTVEDRRFIERNFDCIGDEANTKRPDHRMKSRAKKSGKCKKTPATNNKATTQLEDPGFSGLARQIMNTRDQRLRAALMEHEIRARRLEEENRRYRKILEEKLKTRQMSSPLN